MEVGKMTVLTAPFSQQLNTLEERLAVSQQAQAEAEERARIAQEHRTTQVRWGWSRTSPILNPSPSPPPFPFSSPQAKLVKDATTKFEREMILHAEDIAALQKVKAQLEEAQEAVKVAQASAHAAKSELEVSRASWETQKRALEQEVEKLNSR